MNKNVSDIQDLIISYETRSKNSGLPSEKLECLYAKIALQETIKIIEKNTRPSPKKLSQFKIDKIKSLFDGVRTIKEIAKMCGTSPRTASNYISEMLDKKKSI